MSSFEEWIEEKQRGLLEIREPLALLKAMEASLVAQSVAGKIQVKNHAVYRLVTDSYEMLVINLASYFSGLLQTGPGLNQLNNYLSKLAPGKAPKGSPKTWEERDNLDIKRLNHERCMSAFLHLFPDCASEKPSQEDVQRLKDHLDGLSKKCRDLRNDIHAHRYEKKNNEVLADALELSEIEKLFSEAQQTLHGLRLLVLNSTFAYGEPMNEDETAKDLREIMLHGSFNNFCIKLKWGEGNEANRWYWQRRDDFYDSDSWSAERTSWGFET